MAGKKTHLSLSVRGVLRKSDRELINDHMKWITRDDGTPFACPAHLRAALQEELDSGTELLPMGECDNFDPKHGCMGHPTADDEEVTEHE